MKVTIHSFVLVLYSAIGASTIGGCHAFVVISPATSRTAAGYVTPTMRYAAAEQQQQQPTDAASAIAAAAAASKQYGPTSPEARVAWEIVEEMNSADNSAALGGSLDDECELDAEGVSAACMEYNAKLEELQSLLSETSPYVQNVKNIAADLKAIKLTVGKAKPAARSPAVTAALEAAKAAVEEFGSDSQEARVAWSELEEIASSGLDNAMGPMLDSGNCAIESSIEACEALEEVSRVLSK